jgi:hypothetical protein
MNWVIRLLDALRKRRTITVSASELAALERENTDSQKHALPSNVLEFPGFSTGNRGTDNSVVGAQYHLELEHVKDAATEASRQSGE